MCRSALVAMMLGTFTSPPFVARVRVDRLTVRGGAASTSAAIGYLERGDEVRVEACVPSCGPGAWARIEGDGAVRLDALDVTSHAEPTEPAGLLYARVRVGGMSIYLEPSTSSPQVGRRRGGEGVAFLGDIGHAPSGWLARPSGGFVRDAEVRLWLPSAFHGVTEPALPINLEMPSGRHRLIAARSRPASVMPGARWVHVSLRAQALVAYVGDHAVFATLVSTGLPEHPTPRGTFRVYDKERTSSMHGDPPGAYRVESVPFVQYFARGVALHGTFWHARFGRRASHGCVNLSMSDAAWLFDWAPPRLPMGWHSIDPEAARRETLTVIVE